MVIPLLIWKGSSKPPVEESVNFNVSLVLITGVTADLRIVTVNTFGDSRKKSTRNSP